MSQRRVWATSTMLAFAVSVAASAPVASAAERSLEFGIGVSALRYDDYPGSDQSHTRLLPFPYLVFHSPRIEVDRDKARGLLWHAGAARIELGFSGALPVDSSHNDARRGMPDLAWVGEFGPQLRYRLSASDATTDLELELLTRAAFSIGDPTVQAQGWFASPRVSFLRDWPGDGGDRLTLEGNLGVIYGSSAYHSYYYGVAPAFATVQRPAYDASGGWGGVRFAVGFGVRHGQLWYGGFLRYFDVHDAVFVDSPLVRSAASANLGLAIAYVFD